ncbi:DNA-directed RNA polymerase II subunit RPB7 [Balamuthia mandrillaris]
MVTAVVSIGKGQVVSGNGFVTFPITYKAVVFRPFKGEVVDAVVTQVNKMGFMAEVGPLQVFVSKHLIPSDMNFDANDECFVSDDESIRISKDDEGMYFYSFFYSLFSSLYSVLFLSFLCSVFLYFSFFLLLAFSFLSLCMFIILLAGFSSSEDSWNAS